MHVAKYSGGLHCRWNVHYAASFLDCNNSVGQVKKSSINDNVHQRLTRGSDDGSDGVLHFVLNRIFVEKRKQQLGCVCYVKLSH
jgi:hypothetical protein